MADFLEPFFSFKVLMKIYHWQTSKYSRHIAADALLTKMDVLIDRFMEVYIGRNERFVVKKCNILCTNMSDSDAVTFLLLFRQFIADEFPKKIGSGYTGDLKNILDEMVALVNQYLYLFTLD